MSRGMCCARLGGIIAEEAEPSGRSFTYNFARHTGCGGTMEITVETGDMAENTADAIVVNLFEGVTSPEGGTGAVDRALGGAISDLIAAGETKGDEMHGGV